MMEERLTAMTHMALHFGSHLGTQVGGVLLGGLIVALVLGYLLLFLGALVSVLGSTQTAGMKLVWCVVVFAAPFLGGLLWFFVGRPESARTRRGW